MEEFFRVIFYFDRASRVGRMGGVAQRPSGHLEYPDSDYIQCHNGHVLGLTRLKRFFKVPALYDAHDFLGAFISRGEGF